MNSIFRELSSLKKERFDRKILVELQQVENELIELEREILRNE